MEFVPLRSAHTDNPHVEIMSKRMQELESEIVVLSNQRREAAEALRESVERYRVLVYASSQVLYA